MVAVGGVYLLLCNLVNCCLLGWPSKARASKRRTISQKDQEFESLKLALDKIDAWGIENKSLFGDREKM